MNQNFNYSVIFASSHMFHFVLFWYNQLNPHAQFKKNNDVLTSKECIHAVFGLGFKIRHFIWWINIPVCIKLYP